jgi:hypothetical protein
MAMENVQLIDGCGCGARPTRAAPALAFTET